MTTLISNRKPIVAVIGASSMVGSRFCELSKNTFNLIKADLNGKIKVDITDPKSVDNFFQKYNFDWVILFSAFTEVDAAEKQRNDKKGICWQINVEGTKNVAKSCQKFNRKLIFISTDFVFDGTSGPYNEDDKPGPDLSKVSWYGITKIEAENIIKTTLSNNLILRISYPYRGKFAQKDDIAKRFLKLHKESNLFPVFSDQEISPTFIDDLAPAIPLLISQNQNGTFNLASPQITTQFDFAKQLFFVFGIDTASLQKGSVIEFLKQPGRTPRPIKGGLKVDKIKKLGFTPTNWKEGIQKIYSQSKGKLI